MERATDFGKMADAATEALGPERPFAWVEQDGVEDNRPFWPKPEPEVEPVAVMLSETT